MGFTLANKMLSQSGRDVCTCPTNQQDAENVGRWARGPILLFYFSVLDWGRRSFSPRQVNSNSITLRPAPGAPS